MKNYLLSIIKKFKTGKCYKYETRKLSIQLVPRTAWYDNLRSRLPNWSEISKQVRSIGYCEICGNTTSSLEAHEVWKYDDIAEIQSLDHIVCVCDKCHKSIHFGHSLIAGCADEAFNHYKKINNLTDKDAEADIAEAQSVWRKRSQHDWTINKKQIIDKIYEQLGIVCDFDAPINGRYYAFVPYVEKDDAKQLGAKWDNDRRMWYFLDEQKRISWNNR